MDKNRILKALAGCESFPGEISSEVEMFDILNNGLPFAALKTIEQRGIVSHEEIGGFIAARTLARRKSEKRLSPEESDLIARLIRIHEFAVEVFGNDQKASKWLRTENRAMKGHRPLELLRTDFGARIVETILGRIDHGIYS